METEEIKGAVVEALKSRSIYQLVRDAGCGDPDADASPGVLLLDGVRDAVCELIEAREDWHDLVMADDVHAVNDDGSVHTIADNAPSDYTARRWAEFVDLAAYEEDPADLLGEITDMNQAAAICLYIVAERLAWALIDEAADLYRDAVDEAEAADAGAAIAAVNA